MEVLVSRCARPGKSVRLASVRHGLGLLMVLGGVLTVFACSSSSTSDGGSQADECQRACDKIYDCGLTLSVEGEVLSRNECTDGCRSEGEVSAAGCILNVAGCDESALDACLPTAEQEGCSSCDDANPCTADSCVGTSCEHAPQQDSLTTHCLSTYTADACVGGELVEVSCPAVCAGNGYDAADACQEGSGCGCLDTGLGTACTPGEPGPCHSADELLVCMDAAALGTENNLWLVWDCNTVCREGGYDFSVGCSTTVEGGSSCFCDSCLEAGDPCEVGDCCRDGECTWVDYVGAICVSFGPCPAECQSPSGSTCCRGNFCGGDCVGSPCCN